MLDADWAGSPGADGIEKQLRDQLARNGWSNERAAVVAIDPELEAWAWSDRWALERALEVELGTTRRAELAEVLREPGGGAAGPAKVRLEAVRKKLRIPASSAQFRRFANAARLDRCKDRAFARVRDLFRRWFPA